MTVVRPATVPSGSNSWVYLFFQLHALLWNFTVGMCHLNFWNFNGAVAVRGSKFSVSPKWTQDFFQADDFLSVTIRKVFTFEAALRILEDEKILREEETRGSSIPEKMSAQERLETLEALKTFANDCLKPQDAQGKLWRGVRIKDMSTLRKNQ